MTKCERKGEVPLTVLKRGVQFTSVNLEVLSCFETTVPFFLIKCLLGLTTRRLYTLQHSIREFSLVSFSLQHCLRESPLVSISSLSLSLSFSFISSH